MAVEYRPYRDMGIKVVEESWTPAIPLVSELRALLDTLPIKGYSQYDIALIALGMASELNSCDNYMRGYQDGRAATLLLVEEPLNLLNAVVSRGC